MLLGRHGCRLGHFLISYISIVRSDDGRHAHAFSTAKACIQDVGQAWAANWCVPGAHPLGNALAMGSASRRLDCGTRSGAISQPVSADRLTEFSLLVVTTRGSLPPHFEATHFSSGTPSRSTSKSTASCSRQHTTTLTPKPVFPQQCLPRSHT